MKISKFVSMLKKRIHKSEREGSVLIVVIAMLGALSLMGFLIYTISSESEVNAEYFADSAVLLTEPDVDPDILFDFALRQLILGANENEKMSMFYGGRNSLLPTMLGRDFQPYSGKGINLAWLAGTPGRPVVDMDYDGLNDGTNPEYLTPNYSVSAQGSDFYQSGVLANYPDPDTSITYPDINNMFYAYNGLAPDGARVIIPSFHRPQFFRHLATANDYTDSTAKENILRPHSFHQTVTTSGTISNYKRFIRDAADAADPGLDPVGDTSVTVTGTAAVTLPFPNLTGASTFTEGVWDGSGGYTYDVDTDGNGVKESIYIDLHFPMLETPDGDKFVPLAAMYIIDGDSLINLNAHGNHHGDITTIPATPFGNSVHISRSNQSLSSFEVNPQWALNAKPDLTDFSGTAPQLDSALDQHRYFYRAGPGYIGNPADFIELSNMELFWLLAGRAQFDTGDPTIIDTLYEGRLGEETRLENGISSGTISDFSFPGTSAVDDNNNATEGSTFEHPLALYGFGSTTLSASDGKIPFLTSENRLNFLSYSDYRVHANTGWLLNADPLHSGNLFTGEVTGTQSDEPTETIIEPELAKDQTDDSIFSASENSALQLSDSDRSVAGNTGRVLELAPFNFVSCIRAEDIRKRFTTASWDLQSFGSSSYANDPTYDYGTTPVDNKFRTWEYYDHNSSTNNVFPPIVPAGTDPFRPELRELISILPTDQAVRRLQRKLSINGVLDTNSSGELRFRPLTEHPTTLGNSIVATLGSPPARPEDISDDTDKEWLARYDRQRMARDIYVLLYMFGGGNDNVNYATTATPYTTDELKEMAQFAVNIVDQLDPDNTITLFEYDTNLSNGWNVDDNAYLDTGDTDRAIVYGIEHQQLALNEAAAIFAKRIGAGNHTATNYDDTDHRDFFYLELENVSAYPVAINDGSWQIVVRPVYTGAQPVIPEERRLTLLNGFGTIGVGTSSRFTIGTFGDDSMPDVANVPARLPSHMNVNYDYLDLGLPDDNVIKQIFPLENDTPNPIPNPAVPGPVDLGPDLVSDLDFDLMQNYSSSLYRVHRKPTTLLYADGTEVAGSVASPPSHELMFLAADVLGADEAAMDLVAAGEYTIEIELRRRADLNRTEPTVAVVDDDATNDSESQDNPWVVVDKMTVPLKHFELSNTTDDYTVIRPALTALTSSERVHPMHGDDSNLVDGVLIGPYAPHSIGAENTATVATNSFWQPHYNRDYSSPIELFQVPTFGPDEGTEKLSELTGTNELRLPVDTGAVNSETAGRKFLFPGDMLNIDPDNNRWHRVLNFLEVPSRHHRHLDIAQSVIDVGNVGDDPLGFYRVPGKINLNGLRYPDILAALIDDSDVINLVSDVSNYPVSVDDNVETGVRDWWNEFLKSRDGEDPENAGKYYPGLPTSKPFKSLSFNEGANALDGFDSIDQTILRSLPIDGASTNNRRGLFEIGTAADHTGVTAGPTVNLANRNRLLQKIYNNTTTRSNIFFAYIQIDYFEAVEVDAGGGETVVRIGGLLGTPGYRRFYVIDRSKALDLLEPSDLPALPANPGDPFTFSFNQDFNYKSLILHTQQIN